MSALVRISVLDLVTPETETAQPLLLSPDARVTCPKCDSKFSLQEGFARQALEIIERSTEGALEAVRDAERAEVETRAQHMAAQREIAARAENAQLQQLLKDQAARHDKALKEVRTLAEQAAQPQLAALRTELAERQA